MLLLVSSSITDKIWLEQGFHTPLLPLLRSQILTNSHGVQYYPILFVGQVELKLGQNLAVHLQKITFCILHLLTLNQTCFFFGIFPGYLNEHIITGGIMTTVLLPMAEIK